VYSSLRSTRRELFHLRLDGPATPEPIPIPPTFNPGTMTEPAAWADRGRTLLLRSPRPSPSEPLIWAVPLDGSREPRAALPRTATRDSHVRVSPDGRWIAYEGGEARTEIYVAPIAGGPPFWKISSDGGWLPVWSPTGRELFYRSGDRMMAAAVGPGDTFETAPPRTLFEGHYFEAEPGGPNYDVSLDAQRFLMVLPAADGPARLNVVQGWKAETLRRLGNRK
jgi:hypothetical protein